MVFYYCDDRFDLEGESEIVCIDGEWSGVAPNCTGNYSDGDDGDEDDDYDEDDHGNN